MATLLRIDAKEAKRLVDMNKAVLIDVREKGEQARSWIPGAVLAPLSAIQSTNFNKDRKKTAIFFCATGSRTTMRSANLASAGFRDARELAGGIRAWKNAGFEVAVDPNAPDPSKFLKLAAMGLLALALGAMLFLRG
ncbi:MAG: rhodanese-like domain-containing protein [Hyphomicrobiales bacterium]